MRIMLLHIPAGSMHFLNISTLIPVLAILCQARVGNFYAFSDMAIFLFQGISTSGKSWHSWQKFVYEKLLKLVNKSWQHLLTPRLPTVGTEHSLCHPDITNTTKHKLPHTCSTDDCQVVRCIQGYDYDLNGPLRSPSQPSMQSINVFLPFLLELFGN